MIVNDPAILADLQAAFAAYETALGTNDVAALDAFFWHSDFTLRYGVGENLYGFEAIAAFRRARPGGSPQRVLTRTVLVTFGDSFGVASTEFERQTGGPIGRQTQTWVKTDDGWKIVAAHVSLMGATH